MKKSVLVKATVMSFLAILVGMFTHFDEVRQGALGKDEFLKRESVRFDQFLLHPHYSVTVVIFFMIMVLFGLYELICYLIFKIIKR
jgi:hypothetical protein